MSSTQQLLLGEGAGGAAPVYIEDVFSTYLYDGGFTGAIVNGIDLSTKGGLVWFKFRSGSASETNHELYDTARGTGKFLVTNSTAAQVTDPSSLNSFNTNGFNIQTDPGMDAAGSIYVSWTFREQPKFFDIVTYTGDGTSTRQIAHNLGSVPGAIIIKRTNSTGEWMVYHRSVGINKVLYLNLNTDVQTDSTSYKATPTSSVFTVGDNANVNGSGDTYVAYLFAHDAGGFGLTGADNVISCGTFTTNGSGSATVNLGYEPQYLLMKRTNAAQDWFVFDTMRGFSYADARPLYPNTSGGEADFGPNQFVPTATGFTVTAALSASSPYIYIAIRRGPMKVPTSGTSVFTPLYFTGNDSTSRQLTAGFVTDTFLGKRSIGDASPFVDRLRGKDLQLYTPLTNAEATSSLYCRFDSNTGPIVGYNAAGGININSSAYTYRTYSFGRAPGYFDVVCYTGTGVARTITHNLAAVPEMMIVKSRSLGTEAWAVYTAATGNTKYLRLNDSQAVVTNSGTPNRWNNTTPTSTVFSVGTDPETNSSGATYVNYLFATCAGVSKVGSYTGTGTTLQINCGFTGGARFVMIKRTDSTGGWYVWDTARGIVSGNDAYFLLNSSDEEITNTDYVDTYSAGFEISDTAPAAINASGGTFIFLAIA